MNDSRVFDYEGFILENRIRMNGYLDRLLKWFALTGPAIALGIFGGRFPEIQYSSCVKITVIMLAAACIHSFLKKAIPDSEVTSFFAMIMLNVLLMYMEMQHVSIYLTWFLVPLLSLLLCDRKIYYIAILFTYIMMMFSAYMVAPYYAARLVDYDTRMDYFLNYGGGFTIEMSVMFLAGSVIQKTISGYFRELIRKNGEVSNNERKIQERMRILDSMAEIYDNVNLLNFTDRTETSLRTGEISAQDIDFVKQNHTRMDMNLKSRIMPDQFDAFWRFTNINTVRERLKNKKVISGEFVDKLTGWFRAQYITVSTSSDGVPDVVIYTTRNIDEDKRKEEHLIRISMTDELTRLYNRRCYEEDMSVYKENGVPDDFVIRDGL